MAKPHLSEEAKYNLQTNTRFLREKSGETQEQLADAISKSKQTISHYETGETIPDEETLEAIATHYGVDKKFMLTGGNIIEGDILDLSILPQERREYVRKAFNDQLQLLEYERDKYRKKYELE